MLKIKNVSASYGTRQVIDDISFDLHKGEIVIVVGPNGSGKTTLIRVITGAIKPDKVRVVERPAIQSTGTIRTGKNCCTGITALSNPRRVYRL